MKKGSDKPFEIDLLLRDVLLDEANRLLDVWEATGDSDDAVVVSVDDVEAAVRRLEQALDVEGDRSSPPRADRGPAGRRVQRLSTGAFRSMRTFGGVAAALCVIAVVASATFFRLSQPIERTAAAGTVAVVNLPDGSTVQLNSGSTIRYPRRFGVEREVVLNGEAFFDVVRDERPFEVNTFDASVRVLGTRFNVRAWRLGLEAGTTVALESGSVVLLPIERPGAAVTLSPGESWRISETGVDQLSGVSTTVADATAWRDGDFVYRDTPIAVVIADVERRYGIRIQVTPPGAGSERFSMALRQPKDAESVLSDIAAAVGMNYRARSDGFELFRGN